MGMLGNAQATLSGLIVLFQCASSMTVDIPYYECIRYNNEPKSPGICSTFESHFLSVEIDDSSSSQQSASICAAKQSVDMFSRMSDAMLNWNLESCSIYVKSVIDAELAARKHHYFLENAWDKMDDVFIELDTITESFGDNQWIEGSIWRFHSDDKFEVRDGLQRKRSCLLTTLVSGLGPGAHVAEVGFNAGHSTASILITMPSVKTTSFDICSCRTQLVCGDSGQTLADYKPHHSFDAIFIDGGHLYSQALADLTNGAAIVKPGGLVIVDDCETDHSHYNNSAIQGLKGVSDAWRHAIGQGLVTPFPDTCGYVGLCIGRYADMDSGIRKNI